MDDPSMIQNAVGGNRPMPGMPQPLGPPGLGPPGGMSPFGGISGIEDGGQNNSFTNIDRRLRVLEERFSNIRKRSQISEQNVLKTGKDLSKEIKSSLQEIKDVRMDIHDIKEKFKILVSELRNYATKEEFKVLEKYVNMWEPITFVSKNEVDKLIQEAVEQRFADLNIRIQQEKFIEQEVAKTFTRMRATGQFK